MQFEFPADREFFQHLLCAPDETLDRYTDLFDFRAPRVKRSEFERFRSTTFESLKSQFDHRCLLQYAPDCSPASGLVVDHLIPLSSNKLNKELRRVGTTRSPDGRLTKTPTQSFGSNHNRNLVLACRNCNSLKQNRFLNAAELLRILELFESVGSGSKCSAI